VANLRSVPGGRLTDPVEFEVGFVVEGGGEVRRHLVDVADVAFEQVPAVRSFRSYWYGSRHFPPLTEWIMEEIAALRDPYHFRLRSRLLSPERFEDR